MAVVAEKSRSQRARAPSLAETTPFQRPSEPTFVVEPGEGDAFGPYRVYEQLGEGGMAYVHRAEHVGGEGLRKPVALKRLRTECAEDPELIESFVHEAQLAAKLQHPNIARAYELGKIDGTYYIAMELVPGPTLSQVMIQSQQGGGAVPLPVALEILIQIADALDHAHDLRDESGQPLELIHRDVTPGNIIIAKTGAAKLIDFGIAKAKRATRHATKTGYIKGKHGYIAPEYTAGQLDRRADLFALGVVAHELLTGRSLFGGETELETLRNVRLMKVPPPSRFRPSLSAELDSIVLKALEREPKLRWQDAGSMRNALVEEARRLGATISGPQIRDWIERMFEQGPRRNSSIDRFLRGLSPSMSIQIEVEAPSPPPPTPEATPRIVVEPEALALPPAPVVTPRKNRVHRAPPWRVPTRWAAPQERRSMAPVMMLLAVLVAWLLAIDQGWIDIDRWRQLLGL